MSKYRKQVVSTVSLCLLWATLLNRYVKVSNPERFVVLIPKCWSGSPSRNQTFEFSLKARILRGCRGDWISILFSHRTPKSSMPISHTPCLFSGCILNKNILLAMHVTVLLCVRSMLCIFINDNEEKMPVKQITNRAVFGEIQTATTTFIAF